MVRQILRGTRIEQLIFYTFKILCLHLNLLKRLCWISYSYYTSTLQPETLVCFSASCIKDIQNLNLHPSLATRLQNIEHQIYILFCLQHDFITTYSCIPNYLFILLTANKQRAWYFVHHWLQPLLNVNPFPSSNCLFFPRFFALALCVPGYISVL